MGPTVCEGQPLTVFPGKTTVLRKHFFNLYCFGTITLVIYHPIKLHSLMRGRPSGSSTPKHTECNHQAPRSLVFPYRIHHPIINSFQINSRSVSFSHRPNSAELRPMISSRENPSQFTNASFVSTYFPSLIRRMLMKIGLA